MASSETDLTTALDLAIAEFREGVQRILESEAQKAVDNVIARLNSPSGAFEVKSATVEILVKDVEITPATRRAAAKRGRSRPAKRAARRGGGGAAKPGGRPPGQLRTTLLDHFGAPGTERGTTEIQQLLDEHKVKATPANLHQQLRRLVDAGELTRSGRGRYKRL